MFVLNANAVLRYPLNRALSKMLRDIIKLSTPGGKNAFLGIRIKKAITIEENVE